MRFLLSDSVGGIRTTILCNQENFILRDNSYKLRQAFPDHLLLINPAVKKDLTQGRPSNGMFIALPSNIKDNVTDVSPGFWRIQAVKIQFKTSSTLLINSYFPTDPQRPGADAAELMETLGCIKHLVNQHAPSSILWAGDINSDFSRHSDHSLAVQDALGDLGLLVAWNKFGADFSCSHELLGQTFTSLLDHFFWSSKFSNSVTDAGILHIPGNMSDHEPIYCTFNSTLIEDQLCKPINVKPRPKWGQASLDEKQAFNDNLELQLSEISIPETVSDCNDLHCQDPNHKEDLDQYTLAVLEAIQAAAEESLPSPVYQANKKRKVIPGWVSEVKPYRDNAFFWHQIWKSCGRPINTEIHRIMKNTRNVYHFQFRKCKKAEEKIKRDNLLNACMGNGGDIFKQIKALRKSAVPTATSIDGVTQDIPEYFGKIYGELYNSAEDAARLSEVNARADSKVTESDKLMLSKITPEILKQACKNLKPGKSDPIHSFSSDCFRNAPDSLYHHLAQVLKCCTVHSHVTLVLLLSTLVPLVKDKLGSMNTSKNYRSVAISSILLKIFDWVVIILDGESLGLSELQFAYQAGCSTVMCTWAALETIDYFLRNGSEVFTCATDMSKAFDLTLHSLMFDKMLDKGVSPIFVRLLIHIYSHQVANVRWNGEHSSHFPVRNGCGQGKVLAAIAYCVYCEELFETLQRRHSGCWVRGYYRGIFGYSDDNWVLAPSLSALQDILRTCEEFAASHNLKFSTDPDPGKCKTKCMAFLKKSRDLPPMFLCGNPLPWVDSLKHLGTRITNKIDGCQLDLKQKTAEYINRTCSLNQEFKFAHPDSKIKVNSIYNCHFSGSQVWDLFSPGFTRLESTFNQSIKIMADLPYATHRYLVGHMAGGHMLTKIIRNYLGFIKRVKESPKYVMKQLLSLASDDVRSVTGSNLRNILLWTKVMKVEDLHPNVMNSIQYHSIDEHQMWRIGLIHELVSIKYGHLSPPDGWTELDFQDILDITCTQ